MAASCMVSMQSVLQEVATEKALMQLMDARGILMELKVHTVSISLSTLINCRYVQ